ncbi:MAG TPA: iron-containing alcohol dehydrogenase, partial [Prolixibacteraceae bacterium]|nr:iron-containing alcohol dehydrogenase [Prolixibacteraceae bacterium]
MSSFTFSRIPELVFGAGKLSLLPGLLEKRGNHLLLVTGKGSFSETPQAANLFEELNSRGFQWSIYPIASEPSANIIDHAVDLYRNDLPDVVVSIGGGSVMDAGKAISAMLVSPEKTIRYLEVVGDLNPTGKKVSFIAIPTTAGTGSEATKNAVISKVGENGYKCSLRHNNYIPDVALIDPKLQLSCPITQTACSGMDAFTQLLESYLSTQANPMTDALAVDGIINVHQSLVPLIKHPDEVELRSKMAYAAWLSGITLANAGLGTVHGFAGVLGALFDIPHGVVCGTLMAETNRITLQKLKGTPNEKLLLKKYATIGRIFTGKKSTQS